MRSTTRMAANRRGLILTTCLMLVALVHGSAEASRNRTATVFLDGYVGTAPAGVKTRRTIQLLVGGTRHDFAVTGTGVVKGTRSSQQLMDDLSPKQNQLILAGPAATLGTLTATPPGQLVRITGNHRRGTNQLNVTAIGAPPAAPAAAPTAGKE